MTTLKRTTRIAKISAKTRAKREANGERYLTSTVARSSLSQRKASPRKPRSKKRASKAEDTRIYGPELFRAYLHNHACLGCGYRGTQIQQAHRTTGGMGRKSDWTETGPLCGPRVIWGEPRPVTTEGCHQAHDSAKRSWRTHRGETFAEAQRKFFASWEQHSRFVAGLRGADE